MRRRIGKTISNGGRGVPARCLRGGRRDTIHTHMCYSEFNDIIESVAAMDADVITIETSVGARASRTPERVPVVPCLHAGLRKLLRGALCLRERKSRPS